MQAKHGFAVSFRSRTRLLGCAIALVALAATMFAPSAGAVEPPPVTTYLALGDSIAFGYSEQKFNENFPNEAPTYFQEGYVDFYGKKIKANKEIPNKGLVIVNNGCPGETSGGLNGAPPTCSYQKAGLGLHNPYPFKPSTTERVSQLESALSILKATNPVTAAKPAHPIVAISFNIGGNDELAAVAKCEAEVKKEFEETGKSKHGETTNVKEAILTCIGEAAGPLFNKIIENMGTTLGAIDGPGAYTGKIVVVGFYNPNAAIIPQSDGLQESLNEAVEETFFNPESPNYVPNAVYVNPFSTFNPFPHTVPIGPKEEKAVCKYTEMCNPADIAANKAKKEASNKKEEEEGKTVIFPFNGEGDIHPSKAGYEAIAKKMFEVAPL
jgi:lysophospholipase L1-like esterase